MRELVTFVDSERVDSYVNSVVHCVIKLGVRRVTFLHIKKLAGTERDSSNSGLSARLLESVQHQIRRLAEGYWDDGKRTCELDGLYEPEKVSRIKATYQDFRSLSVEYANRELEYSELRNTLAGYARLNEQPVVDITAVKKRYLGDIVAAALVEGIKGLWTFDLYRTDFSQPWTMLVHDLLDKDFQYTNILDTEGYRECSKLVVVRAPRLKIVAIVSAILVILLGACPFFVDANSVLLKFLGPASGAASIVALGLVFFSPRG